MRKHTRRKPITGLSPIQKAGIRRAWRADNDRASLHAFIGEDPQMLVQQAGGIMYTVLAACEDAGIEGDDPDLCIVHNAGKALVELASRIHIDEPLRKSIVDGLAACERLEPRLNAASLYRATFDVMPLGKS
ncbi:hypothetical protein ACFJIS_15180 [Variovorax boronicumulans]|uniref:hypothetical protein n=1 Tax=Variovorax boronicumulans TaxID=436515 RepID=UPI0036F19B13